MVLGLTGGMGSGKSTAGRMFEEFGFTRVDADDVVRNVILREPEIIQAIASRMGPHVRSAEGGIQRSALARVVFSDDAELLWLEQLIHPRLFVHWRGLLAERPEHPWVFEVPLLFEKQLENWFDFTICVATSSSNQYARLAERGMSHALAEQRISKQLPLVQKLEYADFVLLNDGSPNFLRDQVAKLVNQFRQLR